MVDANVDEHVIINAYSMSFLGDTILVPESYDLPKNFAKFKVIKEGDDPFSGMPIKHVCVTRKESYLPIVAKVASCDASYDELIFLIITNSNDTYHNVSTRDHYIIEVDEVEGKELNPNLENIGDAEENELIEELRRNPSLAERIPQVLWKRRRFQRKILSANLDLESDLVPENVKTMAIMNRVDFLGNKTKTFRHDKVADELSGKINSFLGIPSDSDELHAARIDKLARPQPRHRQTARSGWFSRFRRMFGRGTRKNKKKRYGRL